MTSKQNKKILEIPFPINISQKRNLPYFNGKNKISITQEVIRNLKNVFVTHEGLCIKNGFLLRKCAFNLFGNEDRTFLFSMYKIALEQYLVCLFGKSLPLKKLNGQYIIIHTKWFNYYFWLTSSLYRLIITEKFHNESKILLPENIANLSYVKDTFKMFPNLKFEIIPTGTHIIAENLIFPEVRSWSISISPDTIKEVKTRVLEFAKLNYKLEPNLIASKVYISRKKTGKRGFVNEEEVEKIVVKNGFICISFEDYNLYEQALIMNQAKYVIGLHGAGFANLIYMNKGTSVLELIAIPPNLKEHRIGYWRLSGVIGINYFCQFCKINVKNSVIEILNNDLIADIAELSENIKLMLTYENRNS